MVHIHQLLEYSYHISYCALLFCQPERIDPPDPSKPDYDIRADVWSLGITLVELATGNFPYKDCKTDFEVLTKVLQDDPPSLPAYPAFSSDFRNFVTRWWVLEQCECSSCRWFLKGTLWVTLLFLHCILSLRGL